MIILTSSGLSSSKVTNAVKIYLAAISTGSKIAIVVTAAKGKNTNKYSILAKAQFMEMGFIHIDFIDIEGNKSVDFSEYLVVYVCGGNTFKLLKKAHKTSFKKAVCNLLGRNGIYIGVSAGAIILSPKIGVVAKINPDENEGGAIDFTGLGVIPFEIFPHYHRIYENRILEYEKTVSYKVCRLADGQALILRKGENIFIK